MQIAIPLFDHFAPLDAVGPYQVLVHLPGATVTFVAERPGGVSDESGSFTLQAQASFADVPHPDVILVPGGSGESDQVKLGPLQDWLAEADKTSTWTTSVCTGALVLARAGRARRCACCGSGCRRSGCRCLAGAETSSG